MNYKGKPQTPWMNLNSMKLFGYSHWIANQKIISHGLLCAIINNGGVGGVSVLDVNKSIILKEIL